MKTFKKTNQILLFTITLTIGLAAASCDQPTGDQMQVQEEEPLAESATSFDNMARLPIFDTIARECDDDPVYMIFVHIPGLGSQHSHSENEGEFEIYSYRWGVSNTATSSSRGRGPGKAKLRVRPFVITKPVDRVSPELRRFADSGESIPEAVLTLRMTCGEQQESLVIELEDVVITSYRHSTPSGSSRQVPTEFVILNYSKIALLLPAIQPGQPRP